MWVLIVLYVTLCGAQNLPFSSGTASSSAFSQSGSLSAVSSLAQSGSLSAESSLAQSGSSSASSSIAQSGFGNLSGSSASSVAGATSAQATAVAGTPNYASCVLSEPDTAVRSRSFFSYNLLESTFTNPALRDFYDTSFNLSGFNQLIYDELKSTSPHDAQLIAGSLSLLFGQVFPRISPLVNAVTITNAISDFLALKVVITTEEFDDCVDAFINSVSKSLRNDDGTAKPNSKAIVTALLNYLADHGDLSFSTLNEFISILAGNYRIALYSNCLPLTFEVIPSP